MNCIFYFDVCDPYSYIAASRLEAVARFTGTVIEWVPVFGEALKSLDPEYDSGKACHVSARRQAVEEADLQQQAKRYGLPSPLRYPPNHSATRTVDTGRLITWFPSELRSRLALALFDAYWKGHSNLNSQAVLLRVARSVVLKHSSKLQLDAGIFSDSDLHARFQQNVDDAYSHGAFTTPAFYVPAQKKLYVGQDRLHLLEATLASIKVNKPIARIPNVERLLPRALRTPPESRARICYLWADFSSPWSALAFSQLARMRREAGDSVTIEMKPFHLGALLRRIGASLVPLDCATSRQRAYQRAEMQEWAQFWTAVNRQLYPPVDGIQIRWPDAFPIASALALRVALIEPRTSAAIFKAAWTDNIRIDDARCLSDILGAAGFDGEALVSDATDKASGRGQVADATLRANTDEAFELGLCGAPTFQIGEQLVFGQDRIAVTQDLIAGWRPVSSLLASVGSFPYYDCGSRPLIT